MARLNEIKLKTESRLLQLDFDDGMSTVLSSEFLRIHSPSAEVKGHGPGQAILQTGKKDVAIKDIQSVGNYAVKLIFDDGHDSGIYSWDYLYQLCANKEKLWDEYLVALKQAGEKRDTDG